MGQQLFAESLVETRTRAAAAVPVSMAVHGSSWAGCWRCP